MDRIVTWFDSPAESDEAIDRHYASLTGQERLDEMVEFLNRWGGWHERRLVRTAEVLEFTPS